MKRFLFISLLLFFFGQCYEALAGCGSAACPLNTHRYLKAGWLQIGIAREYINQDRIYFGSSKSVVGAFRQPDQEHDEVQTINSRDILRFKYGIADRVGFNLELPFIHREHGHFNLDQDEWEAWNFSGLSDMTVSGQVAVLLPPSEFSPYLSFLVGAKLSTGVTNAKNAEGEEAEVTIQPGTGSTDIIFGANYRQAILSVPGVSDGFYSTLPLLVDLTYRINGKGIEDWQAGNTLIASIGTEYQFTRRAGLLFQVNGRFQEHADAGRIDPAEVPPGNTGGTWIFASPGLRVQLSDALSAYTYTQIPVYQNVNGIQQTANLNLQFGLSFNVKVRE
jgi:hypothetical protein